MDVVDSGAHAKGGEDRGLHIGDPTGRIQGALESTVPSTLPHALKPNSPWPRPLLEVV